MSLVTVLGWSAAVIGAFFAMPQFLRVVRTGSTAGLSLVAWQLQSAGALAWTSHGVIYSMPNQILANTVISFCCLGVVYYLIRHRNLWWPRVVTPILLVAILLAAVDLRFGQLAFGFAVLVPGSVALVAQLHDLIRSPDVSGVSSGYLALGMVIQTLWFVWSLQVGDESVTIASSVAFALLAACLWVWTARTKAARSRMDAWDAKGPATKVAP